MKPIVLIYLICSPISIIGSLFIIVTWGLFAKLKHSGSNFIFFQSISDFLFTLKYVVTVILYFKGIPQFDDQDSTQGTTSTTCFILGAYGQFFGQATVLWSLCMTFKVSYSFFFKKPPYKNNSNTIRSSPTGKKINFQGESIKFYHLFVWGVCGVNALIIGIFKQYGASSNGCWIIGDQNPFRFFELIPLYFTILVSIIVLIAVLIKMRNNRQRWEEQPSLLTNPSETYESQIYHKQEKEFRNQLIKYILIFVVFWLGPTILRTLEFFKIEQDDFILLDAVSVSLQAFANSIVWFTSPQFFKLLKRKVKKPFHTQLEREFLINK